MIQGGRVSKKETFPSALEDKAKKTGIERAIYNCTCPSGWYGPRCGKSSPCLGVDCGPGKCKVVNDAAYFCVCNVEGVYGLKCGTATATPDPCTTSANTCGPNSVCMCSTQVVKCYCYLGWTGSKCKTPLWPQMCDGVTCSGNGNCAYLPNGTAAYFCMCNYGWTGANCETQTFCGGNPDYCQNGGYCVDNSDGSYYCRCLSNYGGAQCEVYDLCQGTTCSGRGTCGQIVLPNIVVLNCDCDGYYAGLDCSDESPQTLVDAYGADGYAVLQDLISGKETNNAQFLSALPFVTLMLDTSTREALGYNVDEFITNVEFEGQSLVPSEVFLFFLESTLGNCFTFGAASLNYTFHLRATGLESGLRVRIGSFGNESLPWEEKSASTVFIHESTKTVTYESISYTPIPGQKTRMTVSQTFFSRLRMGKFFSTACASKTSDVKSFYASGEYTVESCLRSCYQDKSQKVCGCMDPRYNKPASATVCTLSNFQCCESITTTYGDPFSWSDCFCPPPCKEWQYSVVMTTNNIDDDCSNFVDNDTCTTNQQESDIEIVFADTSHMLYVENQAFPAMKIVVNMGGYGGLLAAFCMIVLCELVALGYIIFKQLTSKKEKRKRRRGKSKGAKRRRRTKERKRETRPSHKEIRP